MYTHNTLSKMCTDILITINIYQNEPSALGRTTVIMQVYASIHKTALLDTLRSSAVTPLLNLDSWLEFGTGQC